MKKSWQDTQLIISDLQIPFEHIKALDFCRYLKKHFKVKDSDVYNVGDETDQYWGGLWKKSIEAEHTANQELEESKDTLRKWYRAFPKMKLCTSNHGTRWWRKALDADIPAQLLRDYEDIIEAPKGWQWKRDWHVKASKHPFIVEHLDDYGGQRPHIDAALHNGVSTVGGHHHNKFQVDFIKTKYQDIWAAVAGCLIDHAQYAFTYSHKNKRVPKIGCIVIVDGGRIPLCIPLD